MSRVRGRAHRHHGARLHGRRPDVRQEDDVVAAAMEAGAEGIGLYRTELLFLSSPRIPTEEQQYEAFREVMQAYKTTERPPVGSPALGCRAWKSASDSRVAGLGTT